MSGDTDSAAQAPLVAHLCVAHAAKAIDFYAKAFGAQELMRLPGPDGRLLHAAVRINGAMVMLNDEYPEMDGFGPAHFGGTAVTLTLNVPDADAAAARALAAGAKEIMAVAEQFWGDRYGLVEDPFGHRWAFATPVRQVSVDELQAAARSMA
jgi:PhnB protein